MIKTIVVSLLLTIASAQARLNLGRCINFGGGVSANYTSCVNNNFSAIARAIGMETTPYCFAIGSRVYPLTNCINTAMSRLERESGADIFTNYCLNLSERTLDAGFESCVTQNFAKFSRNL